MLFSVQRFGTVAAVVCASALMAACESNPPVRPAMSAAPVLPPRPVPTMVPRPEQVVVQRTDSDGSCGLRIEFHNTMPTAWSAFSADLVMRDQQGLVAARFQIAEPTAVDPGRSGVVMRQAGMGCNRLVTASLAAFVIRDRATGRDLQVGRPETIRVAVE